MARTAQEMVYEVGGIPDLPAWADTPLEFRIDTGTLDADPTPAMAVDRHPAGPISFDPVSGAFSYETGEGDKAPFTVTFSGTRRGGARQPGRRHHPGPPLAGRA